MKFHRSISIALLLLAAPSLNSADKLNPPYVFNQMVVEFDISPDGSQVVYRARQDGAAIEIYSVPITGGASLRLNPAITPPRKVTQFKITPDSGSVVYRADQNAFDIFELFSSPVTGGGNVKLNNLMILGGDIREPLFGLADEGFIISPDSSRVVYIADQETDNVQEIFSSPIATGGATKLNGTLTPGGVVDSGPFAISPDNSRAFFIADQDTDNAFELFSVPLAGGVAPTRLNPALPAGRIISTFVVTPDSSLVVYDADQSTADVTELYSVPAGGGAVTKLNPTPVLFGDVTTFSQVSPDGSRVVYVADQETDDVWEIFTSPLGGVGANAKLNPDFAVVAIGSAVIDFRIAPDSSRVVYQANQDDVGTFEIYSASLTGGGVGANVKLNGPLTDNDGDIPDPFFSQNFLISPDSSRVVYRADQTIDEVVELYSVPLAGGAFAKLNPPLPVDRDVESFAISADSKWIVYLADQDTDEVFELYKVPLDGSAPAEKLNDPLVATGDVEAFAISGDSRRVVYQAVQDIAGVPELYAVDLEAPFFQPDSRVGKRNLRLGPGGIVLNHRGNNLYNLTGAGQTITVRFGRRSSSKDVFFSIENDGNTPDPIRVFATRPRGNLKGKFLRLTGGHLNVTGAVKGAGFVQPAVSPGEDIAFKGILRKKRPTRRVRQVFSFTAQSETVPGLKDVSKAKVR